jgi:hypothetical protein
VTHATGRAGSAGGGRERRPSRRRPLRREIGQELHPGTASREFRHPRVGGSGTRESGVPVPRVGGSGTASRTVCFGESGCGRPSPPRVAAGAESRSRSADPGCIGGSRSSEEHRHTRRRSPPPLGSAGTAGRSAAHPVDGRCGASTGVRGGATSPRRPRRPARPRRPGGPVRRFCGREAPGDEPLAGAGRRTARGRRPTNPLAGAGRRTARGRRPTCRSFDRADRCPHTRFVAVQAVDGVCHAPDGCEARPERVCAPRRVCRGTSAIPRALATPPGPRHPAGPSPPRRALANPPGPRRRPPLPPPRALPLPGSRYRVVAS